ncbi:MAG: cytochrome c3 family protein [Candidatus Sumerlaeota bacterium]|nr:cytochrome c3 family protein [Candidatus Sumerlaeota bacterium]
MKLRIHRGEMRGGDFWRGRARALIPAIAILAALGGLTRSLNATIRGSAHDFSGLHPQEQICIFCHTPHDADLTVTDAPLWNHQVTSKVFVVYNSPTMDASVGQPQGASRLCLSCHDGTVAVDSYGGKSGSIFLGGKVAVGADELNNDHPISFTYDDALAALDGGLFPPSSTPSGLGNTIRHDLLIADQLECSSCHDVHNGPAAAAVNDNLLVITQVQSQLCLTCHNK